jgi:hypothetical protein
MAIALDRYEGFPPISANFRRIAPSPKRPLFPKDWSAMWSMKTSGAVSAFARQSSGRRLRSQNMQARVSGGTWAV